MIITQRSVLSQKNTASEKEDVLDLNLGMSMSQVTEVVSLHELPDGDYIEAGTGKFYSKEDILNEVSHGIQFKITNDKDEDVTSKAFLNIFLKESELEIYNNDTPMDNSTIFEIVTAGGGSLLGFIQYLRMT